MAVHDRGSQGYAGLGFVHSRALPVVLGFSEIVYFAEEGSTAVITVERTGSGTGPVSVDYATSDGTAMSGAEYTAATGTIEWADGDMASKTVSITTTADAIDEAAFFLVTLSQFRGATGPASVPVVITPLAASETGGGNEVDPRTMFRLTEDFLSVPFDANAEPVSVTRAGFEVSVGNGGVVTRPNRVVPPNFLDNHPGIIQGQLSDLSGSRVEISYGFLRAADLSGFHRVQLTPQCESTFTVVMQFLTLPTSPLSAIIGLNQSAANGLRFQVDYSTGVPRWGAFFCTGDTTSLQALGPDVTTGWTTLQIITSQGTTPTRLRTQWLVNGVVILDTEQYRFPVNNPDLFTLAQLSPGVLPDVRFRNQSAAVAIAINLDLIDWMVRFPARY